MSLLKYSRILLPIMVFTCLYGSAQTSADQEKQDKYAQLKRLIDSKKYHFHALSATSMKGRVRQLTTEYGLTLNNDSLNVDLPYFGRSYSADYAATDLSIQFNTSQFSYVADTTKKGGWEITIGPKNQPRANKIFMSVSASGYCTVQVTSNTRDPISYYGTINAFNDR
jgi:hypothetical protein